MLKLKYYALTYQINKEISLWHYIDVDNTRTALFVLLAFFFWPLCCLYFFDLRLLITPFVHYNFCYIRW